MVLDTKILVNYYFEAISKIPRGSYQEEKIADYVEAFAKEQGLRYYRDKLHNVIIYKDATEGYEDHETLMLEAHMDMVNEKNKDSDHDFEHDPLDLYVEDGYVKARGTTLGADDGYGVSYMLALLSEQAAKHPALECVFTVSEEVGLDGAMYLDTSLLQATRMISLDSENEGAVCTTSSGGCDVLIKKEISFISNDKPGYCLFIKGLLGGHSGGEIHQERANANKLAGRVLYHLIKNDIDVQLVKITGGLKNNAIPRECEVVFVSSSEVAKIKDIVAQVSADIKGEYAFSDPKIELSLNDYVGNLAIDQETSKEIIKMLYLLKNGFIAKSMVIDNLTTISLNLGVITTTETEMRFEYLLRSPMKSAVNEMTNELELVANMFKATTKGDNYYPGWNYEENSALRASFKRFYYQKTGQEVVEEATHGGLETGIFKGKMPQLDIITMGPNMSDIHTPDEKMELASFVRCYDLLKEFIAQI